MAANLRDNRSIGAGADGADERSPCLDCSDIRHGQAVEPSPLDTAEFGLVGNKDQIRAIAGELVQNLLPDALHNRDHDDDGHDADNYAEHGQERPQFVRPKRSERDTDGFEKNHRVYAPAVSAAFVFQ